MSEILDFGGVESATSSSYLKPGQYTLSVKDIKLSKPEGKTPFLEITLGNKAGGTVKEKFFITPKALGRLQYLHEGWFGKKLEKAFGSVDEVGAYFQKAFASDRGKSPKNVIVGGQEGDNGRVYAGLPFTNFIVPETQSFEEGEYEPGSVRYNDYVRKAATNAATGTSDAILSGGGASSSGDEDMPWN